jgi:hypothetical protein
MLQAVRDNNMQKSANNTIHKVGTLALPFTKAGNHRRRRRRYRLFVSFCYRVVSVQGHLRILLFQMCS